MQQFADRAGVTIRALRHYDRLGLLSPRRTGSGYRAYTDADLATLEQIVALKFIGIPLRKIPMLRRTSHDGLARAFRAQRLLLQEKRDLLDRAVTALDEAERQLASGQPAPPELFTRIIEVIAMQDEKQDWKGKYDTLVDAKIERLQSTPPEALAELRSQWKVLLTDIQNAIPRGPADPSAPELAARWLSLLERLMGRPADPAFVAHYQSRDWMPAMASFVDEPTWNFMREVLRRTQ